MSTGFGSFVEEVTLFHRDTFFQAMLRTPAHESMADDRGLAEKEVDAVKKAKKRVFSIVKAVKANARAHIGIVPAEKVLPDPKDKALREPRHRETLQDLIEKGAAED